MGSAGHAFLAHTKALSPSASVRDGGWGDPPHPLEVRPGQRYWPRAGRRRRVFVVKRVSGEEVVVQRLDGAEERVRLKRARVLATRPEDGQGRHYAFGGCIPRRYATHAALVALDGEQAVLVVPEWHPARPVRLPLRQLPAGGADVGTWYRVTADLGAASAARLSVAGFVAVEDPGPGSAHRPAWSARDAPRPAPPRPSMGRGCGDLVVNLTSAEARAWLEPPTAPTRRLVLLAQRPPEVHRTGQTPRMDAGARLYLAAGGTLLGFVTVAGQRRHPGGGDVFTTSAELQPAETVEPFASFANWRWRWWERAT